MYTAAAILYGWAVTVLTAVILGFVHGGLNQPAAVTALCAGGAITTLALLTKRRGPSSARPRGWEWFPIVLFGLFSLRAFLWLIFREGDELRVLSPNNLGDMSLHLTFIHYLANGAPFWPDNPIFAQGKLSYSVGTDLFNALLVLVGVDDVRGLIWVGLVGALLSGVALWHWGRSFALIGFLCSGGLLALAAFTQPAGEPFFQDYPGNLKFDWAWKSLPLALLVTQRGFLFALPAGLLLLASWRARAFGEPSTPRLPAWGEWLLYAAMPIFHLHTFLALSFVLAAWFCCRKSARPYFVKLVAGAFIPATILVYLTIGMFRSNAEPPWFDMSQYENPPKRPAAAVLGWQPGWMVNEPLERFDPWTLLTAETPGAEAWEAHGRFLLFWLGNFGVLPILLGATAWLLLRRITQRAWSPWWALAGALAFIAITPLLGQRPEYQLRSVSGWFLGADEGSVVANAILASVAILAIAGWLYARRQQRFSPSFRWLLFTVSALLFVDGVFAIVHHYVPAFPLLRANALPLLFATVGFALILAAIARHRGDVTAPAAQLFPGLFLFFVCCNVLFAPSAWDNTKLMLWAYLLVLPPLWEMLLVRWHWLPRAVALVGLFFSGFVSLLGGLNSQYAGYPIARISELDAVRAATKDIPITATFLAHPTYDHPLLLVGRKLTLGYPAHVWSHGIQSRRQESLLNQVMEGEPNWRISAAWLGAQYLFFGPREEERWPHSPLPWRDNAMRLHHDSFGELFDLDAPPIPLEGTP